jgi:hypothetical protein
VNESERNNIARKILEALYDAWERHTIISLDTVQEQGEWEKSAFRTVVDRLEKQHGLIKNHGNWYTFEITADGILYTEENGIAPKDKAEWHKNIRQHILAFLADFYEREGSRAHKHYQKIAEGAPVKDSIEILRDLPLLVDLGYVEAASISTFRITARGMRYYRGADDSHLSVAEQPARQHRPIKEAPRYRPSEIKRALQVFLCHSSGDKLAVRELYGRLRSAADYIVPWLDEEDLLPGQRWQDEIPKAIRNSDVVIVCLSRSSISKKGYVQKEIKFALDVADEQPEGTIYLIPVGLEDCEIPDRLKHLHCVNLRDGRGFEQLLRSLQSRAEKLGISQVSSSIKHVSPDRRTEQPQIAELRQELLSDKPSNRAKAARQLGRLGPAAAITVPTLIKKLKDPSGPVRDAAAWALREIGTKPALDALARYENE